jgi:hypothetical protein
VSTLNDEFRAAGVKRIEMSGARGLLLGGLAVVLLEAVTGGVGLVLLGPAKIVAYLLVCAGATAGVTALALWAITSSRGDDGGEGGGPGRGDGEDPPPWWPGFERDFRRYARARERKGAGVDRRPVGLSGR